MLESKRRAAIFLLLAFLLAAGAGYLVLDKVRDLNAELGGMTKIYIANGNIPVRTLIEGSQIRTMDIPNKFLNDAHITDKDEIINNVSVVPLAEGEIITNNMLKPFTELRDENNRLVAMYPSEKVQFDQVVETLDRVDIVVSTDNNGEQKTEVFMRDVPVAFAQGTEEDFAGVALEVSIEDAPRLIHMQNYADKVRVLKANVGKEDISPAQLPDQQDQDTVEEEQPPEKEEEAANEETEAEDGAADSSEERETEADQNNN
ncbi:SAF domain-containing protein [Cytobacillus gottheilii]|uniref:Flp pilus assembly protein CpaB n=1 Tax=Cytobacillus gottheilii TaxID=859144 RepID=A0ABX8FD58_9BACI|nr:SAF domain-containing protein [Cytobacillus gottheilii]QVY62004.1 flp pilus assembly protein CpaB [Cytobacillus gottheilii]